jgi:hypothetical protein
VLLLLLLVRHARPLPVGCLTLALLLVLLLVLLWHDRALPAWPMAMHLQQWLLLLLLVWRHARPLPIGHLTLTQLLLLLRHA